MTYSVRYKSSVKRDLKRIDKSEARRILDEIERDLGENPERHPPLKGQFAGLRRKRIGPYRVIFAILGEEVVVLRIGHRREVY